MACWYNGSTAESGTAGGQTPHSEGTHSNCPLDQFICYCSFNDSLKAENARGSGKKKLAYFPFNYLTMQYQLYCLTTVN
jgi:hypothetical protein